MQDEGRDEYALFVELQNDSHVKTESLLEKVVYLLPQCIYGSANLRETASPFYYAVPTQKSVKVYIELQFRQIGHRKVENVKLFYSTSYMPLCY